MKDYKHPLHNAWRQMVGRCQNPKNPAYPSYGGRGIKVCDRWLSFDLFVADMSPRPAGLSLDRKNVNGDYCPENCRWLNRKGQTKLLVEWAEETGIPMNRITRRIDELGWSVERAILTPVKGRLKYGW